MAQVIIDSKEKLDKAQFEFPLGIRLRLKRFYALYLASLRSDCAELGEEFLTYEAACLEDSLLKRFAYGNGNLLFVNSGTYYQFPCSSLPEVLGFANPEGERCDD